MVHVMVSLHRHIKQILKIVYLFLYSTLLSHADKFGEELVSWPFSWIGQTWVDKVFSKAASIICVDVLLGIINFDQYSI